MIRKASSKRTAWAFLLFRALRPMQGATRPAKPLNGLLGALAGVSAGRLFGFWGPGGLRRFAGLALHWRELEAEVGGQAVDRGSLHIGSLEEPGYRRLGNAALLGHEEGRFSRLLDSLFELVADGHFLYAHVFTNNMHPRITNTSQ